jgi:hypothetical protein
MGNIHALIPYSALIPFPAPTGLTSLENRMKVEDELPPWHIFIFSLLQIIGFQAGHATKK